MPTILETGALEVQKKIQELESTADNDAMALDIDRNKAELSVEKNWKNGWGIVAWAQAYWNGQWNAGGKVQKRF